MNCLRCGKARQAGSLLCADCQRNYRLANRPDAERAQMKSNFKMSVIARRYAVNKEGVQGT